MRFGEFDVDERAGVLRRAGTRIKLQDLPFRLLVVLLRRAVKEKSYLAVSHYYLGEVLYQQGDLK